MKRIVYKIHLWIGVIFGIFIFLICLSGASLIFEKDIARCIHPEYYHIEPGSEPLPLANLLRAVETTLEPESRIAGVTISSDPSVPYRIIVTKPSRASVVVDQYRGSVIGTEKKMPFFSEAVKLHRRFFDVPSTKSGNPSFGKLLVAVSTIILIFALITGIIIWWHGSRHTLFENLKIPLRSGFRRFFYGLHGAGGVYVVIFLIAIGATGLTWSFKCYSKVFYACFGADVDAMTRTSMKPMADGEKRLDSDYIVWQQVAAEIERTYPARTYTIKNGNVTLPVASGNPRAADTIKFDAISGELGDIKPYADTPRIDRLRGWVYSIHTGQWWGIWSKIITFIAALIGASLPLTGYYLWIKRLRAKSHK